jgi:hypothetical protein
MIRLPLFVVAVALSGCMSQTPSAPRGTPNEPGETQPDAAAASKDTAPPHSPADAAPLAPTTDAATPAPDATSLPDAASAPGTDTTDPAPPASGPFLVAGLNGDVTAAELDAFIQGVSSRSIPTAMWNENDTGSHNILSEFGGGGAYLEAINLVYEIARDGKWATQQRKLLDLAIRWNDAWLIHRNDLPLGEHRVMWTGKVEPIWPPNHPMDPEAAYAASETADTVGILAYTALNIAGTPALANMPVSDGDPNHLGATYLARAHTYLAMLEVPMDEFFIPNFLDTATLTIHHPSAPAYAIPGTPGGSQNVNAWNRMMLFMHAFQTLGQIHHLIGDDARKDTMYRAVVQNTVDLFVKNAVPHPASDGTQVYDWGYGNFGDIINHLSNEDLSHGQIDILGLTRAQRAGFTVSGAQMKTYADTVLHELRLAPNKYASSVNSAKATGTHTTLPRGWLTLSPYQPDLLKAVAGDILTNGVQARDGTVAAYVLWAKHRAATASQP